MPGGRPTKYDPAMCERIVECGAQGAGMAEMAAAIGVCRDTVNEWVKQHPEFSAAITRARELSAGWWEAQGRKGIWSREFNAQAYSLQVRNRFPGEWRDKQDHELAGRDGGALEVVVTRRVIDPGDGDAT